MVSGPIPPAPAAPPARRAGWFVREQCALRRPRSRNEQIAQGIAHEVERQDHREDRQARQEHDVRAEDHELAARREHAAPVRGGGLGAEAEEAQPRGREDLGADVEAERDDDRRVQVRQHVAEQDVVIRAAEGVRGLDELARADCKTTLRTSRV